MDVEKRNIVLFLDNRPAHPSISATKKVNVKLVPPSEYNIKIITDGSRSDKKSESLTRSYMTA